MAGIYLHIPFCTKACHYCDFYFSTSLKNKSLLVEAIIKEIELRKGYLGKQSIETIYFGGGTPSLLSEKELNLILETIHKNFNVTKNPEVTLEANPDDLTYDKLKELKLAGVNRLSIGIQSFFDEDLKWMNRSHSNQQSYLAVRQAQDLGINNITIDLIYGIPYLTLKNWEYNLNEAVKLNVPHISSYCLTVEEKTVLNHQVKKGITKMPADSETLDQFKLMIEFFNQNGFEHYEISNFAKDGYISKHNSSYWLGKYYLGIGPSAHSFNGYSRSWNIANNNQYIKLLNESESHFESEEIDKNTAYNEYILTRLRTKWGLNKNEIKTFFGINKLNELNKSILPFIQENNIIDTGDYFVIAPEGKFIIDAITADLFTID